MQQARSDPAPLTRKDLIGGPREWLLLIGMVGLMYLAGEASAAYPILEANPPASFAIAGVVLVATFWVLARARRRLMPWGPQARLFMWATLVAFAAYIGAVAWFLVSFGNGALDGAPGKAVRYTIVSVRSYNSHLFLRITPESQSSADFGRVYPLDVSEADWEASSKGMSVLLNLRPGFFGFPWIAGYRLCASAGSC